MKANTLKVLILSMIGLLLVTGCGEKEDHFKISKKNMQDLKSYSMEIDIEMQMKTGGIAINLPITLSGDVDIANNMSKLQVSSELMGSSFSSTTYVDGSDADNVIEYSSADGINWTKAKSQNNNQVSNLVSPDNIKEIKSEDKDYYVYEATLDKDKMSGILDEELINEDMMGSIDITNNIVFKYYVNKKTKYIDKIVADLVDIINVTDKDSNQEVELTKLNFEIKFSNFNEVEKIVIPEDVKNAMTQSESNDNESKTMKCYYKKSDSDAIFDLSYFADYEGLYVTNIRSDERITTDDASILATYKKAVEETYAPFADVEYYNYNVEIDGNMLISTTDINYNKIDVDKVLEINPASVAFIKNGKININDLKKTYEAIGATCEME